MATAVVVVAAAAAAAAAAVVAAEAAAEAAVVVMVILVVMTVAMMVVMAVAALVMAVVVVTATVAQCDLTSSPPPPAIYMPQKSDAVRLNKLRTATVISGLLLMRHSGGPSVDGRLRMAAGGWIGNGWLAVDSCRFMGARLIEAAW